jgi:DNA polymerase III subunit epsilon
VWSYLTERRPAATWHSYFNPGRPVPAAAVAVHGLTDEKLRSAPTFAERAAELVAFVACAPLVAHNAAFQAGHPHQRSLHRPVQNTR